MESFASEDPETRDLLDRAGRGDGRAVEALFERHRRRLGRMVELRLDRNVRGRLGASDVLQETYLEASRRLGEYLRNPTMPFYLWLRFLASQQVLLHHRRHLRAQVRSADREVALDGQSPASSASLAERFIDSRTSPSQAAAREEMRERLQEALSGMDPIDREVIALRHFEQLSNAEAARVLAIGEDAASKRYLRALRRLKTILIESPREGRRDGTSRR